MTKLSRLAAALVAAHLPVLALAAAPQYTITDLGTIASVGNSSAAWGMSSSGNYITGTTLNFPQSLSSQAAFTWQPSTGLKQLGTLSGYNYDWGYGVNNVGVSVGVAALSSLGSNPVPVMWSSSGVATALKMPTGQTVGRARDINDNGVAVGSVGSGISEQAAIFNTVSGKTTVINATTADGTYMSTAYAINNAGLIVGTGTDASSMSVPVVYDMNTDTLIQIAATPSRTTTAFSISENGIVAGTATQTNFIWSQKGGFVVVPQPSGNSTGQLYSVNSAGWAVGTGSALYANPFLYADGSDYLLADLLVNPGNWNMSTTTSTRAMGIADNGQITGWAMLGNEAHAFVMTPVPEPATYGLMALGLVVVGGASSASRRRKAAASS